MVLNLSPLMLVVIAGGVLVVVVAVVGAAMALSGSQDKRRKRALTVIRGEFGKASKKDLAAAQSKRQAALTKKLKDQEGDEGKNKKEQTGTIRVMMQSAGLNLTALHFWMMSIVCGGIVMGGMMAANFGAIPAVLAGMAGFFMLPRMILKKMAAGRQKKFLEDFPDALDAVVRLLKAGTPIAESIAMLAKEYTGPIGEEMSTMYDRQRIGVPLYEAATEVAVRIPLPEVNMFATALTIQAQTGSSLSEILTNLSSTIRGRFRLKRKAKALAQEATASAAIIGALPFLVMGGLYLSDREYIMLLFTTDMGKILFWGAMFWMSLGVITMRQMINFKV